MRKSSMPILALAVFICVLGSVKTVAAQDEGSNDAQFVTQSVPATIAAGQSVNVSITMKNTGTSTWSGGAGYKLGSQNPQDNTIWGLNRVSMPSSQAVSPGKLVIFSFNVTAPLTTGLYNFQWQMMREGRGGRATVYFGETSPNVEINVIGATGGYNNADFISQTVPTPMAPGSIVSVSITMENNGYTTWNTPAGYKLGSQSPPGNTTWGLSSVELPSSVAPGEQVTFNFNVTAPPADGIYNFQWQMTKEGTGFFGEITQNVAVYVSTGGGGDNDSAFVDQTGPASVVAGQTFGISVIMTNTGTTTWATGYYLASQNPVDNTIWDVNRVGLAGPVAPGAQTTFLFNITAPAALGTYNLQWRMIQEGVEYFGESTANVQISVTAPPSGDTALGNNLATPTIFAEAHGLTGFPTLTNNGLRGDPLVPVFDIDHIYVKDGLIYYPQQAINTWQAGTMDGVEAGGERVVVNWSDNLLNTRWTPKQVIRVETVLYKDPILYPTLMTAYTMEHLYGSGTSEMWGADGMVFDSAYKTVFSVAARLKVEKLDGPNGNVVESPCSFNGAIYEKFGLDGPGGYTAEVNVSGNLIYGYNWQLNACSAPTAQKTGWWRLTFSIDPQANYTLDAIPYSVLSNTILDSLDPGDLLGTFFKPKPIVDNSSVLEIEISAKGGGKPPTGGGPH